MKTAIFSNVILVSNHGCKKGTINSIPFDRYSQNRKVITFIKIKNPKK